MNKPTETISHAQTTISRLKIEIQLASDALRAVEETMDQLENMNVNVTLHLGHSATLRNEEIAEMVGDLTNAEVQAQITLDLEV